MRTKIVLCMIAILSVVAACTDVVTPTRSVAPANRSNHTFAGDCSDPDAFSCDAGRALPPPPSLDTIAVTLNNDGSSLAGAPTIRVQYFMNKTDNNGWITFRNQTSSAVTPSADARVSIHQGVVSGKGTLSMQLPGSSVLSIDLSKGIGKDATFNGDCAKGCGAFGFSGLVTPKLGTPSLFSGQIRIAPPPTHGT